MPKNITVVKVPADKQIISRDQIFPRMPRLYLELLENKEKIRKNLLLEEYTHVYEDDDNIPYLQPSSPGDSSSDDESFTEPPPRIENDDTVSVDQPDDRSIALSEDSDVSVISGDNTDDDDDMDQPVDIDLVKKLNDILESDDEEREKSPPVNKYSKKRDKHGYTMKKEDYIVPPSLSQIQAGDYDKNEQREANVKHVDDDTKRELLFKFDLLRKSYPTANIPLFTIHTQYEVMLNAYEDNVRRLSLDSSVESYKKYLIYGFMGCEYLLGRFLKLDMEGFTQQQIVSMNSYDKLLIELGEKSYMPDGSRWPIEVRLLFMIIMNAAFFAVSKMIINKTGSNLMGMMNTMMSSNNSPPPPKKKMQAPDDLDDF